MPKKGKLVSDRNSKGESASDLPLKKIPATFSEAGPETGKTQAQSHTRTKEGPSNGQKRNSLFGGSEGRPEGTSRENVGQKRGLGALFLKKGLARKSVRVLRGYSGKREGEGENGIV